ncbi:MAG: polyprenyl diphosphate synthase [Rickettsiales bacterium]
MTSSRTLPRHIAVIMDGNRRWARKRGLPPAFGHRKGSETARDFVRLCMKFGIPYVTLYAFSTENAHRSSYEVRELMELMRDYLRNEAKQLEEEGVALRFIGDVRAFPEDLRDALRAAEERSAPNSALRVNVAIGYGAKQEIADACRALCRDAITGEVAPENIDVDAVAAKMYSADCPDPDLLIRTGGEKRLSNFLLWQCAYAELYFCDALWPDFNERTFTLALDDYCGRERRYGGGQ